MLDIPKKEVLNAEQSEDEAVTKELVRQASGKRDQGPQYHPEGLLS